jgi:hypothetical protein
VTVITGPALVVSAVVCFFEESTRQARRKNGKREAGSGKREQRRKVNIGRVANVEAPELRERQYASSELSSV